MIEFCCNGLFTIVVYSRPQDMSVESQLELKICRESTPTSKLQIWIVVHPAARRTQYICMQFAQRNTPPLIQIRALDNHLQNSTGYWNNYLAARDNEPSSARPRECMVQLQARQRVCQWFAARHAETCVSCKKWFAANFIFLWIFCCQKYCNSCCSCWMATWSLGLICLFWLPFHS